MAKKQVTMQLDPEVIAEVTKEAKKAKKAKQVIVNQHLKKVYGI